MVGSALLTGCITDVWTGASLVYDRHNIYKQINEFQLSAAASRALYKDKVFKGHDCSIDIAEASRDILLAGYVPTAAYREEAFKRVSQVKGYRHIYNELAIGKVEGNALQDNWITTKIRSNIFADASIDPHPFKVVTAQGIVYLMGDVYPKQAAKVIQFARDCNGVKRVVVLFRYIKLTDRMPKSKVNIS